MTKEELIQDAIQFTKYYSTVFRVDDFLVYEAFLKVAEPREKRIAELEAQIEKMENCRNCKNEKIEGACGHFTQVGWCKNWELAD